jgi:hypothetical protein
MKDPHSIMHEKEQDLERVRKEVQALLTVIPLLADDQPSSKCCARNSLGFFPDMAQLEIY